MSDSHETVYRWLRHTVRRPEEGMSRVLDGDLWLFVGGDWRCRGPVDAEPPPVPSRAAQLLHRHAEMQAERVTDFRGVLPDQYAVEVDDRGKKRTDYIGVPIRNADGSLNKYGKALLDAHETPNRRESELGQEISAVQQGG